MAIAQTLPHSPSPAEATIRSPGPFGLPWMFAVLFSEAAFIVCRAAAQHSVGIDDLACWLAGAMPFIVQSCANRLFSTRSTSLVELWMLALATYLMFQMLDAAHFVEHPINLRTDLSVWRGLVTAGV